MANTNFTPWLGTNATANQQQNYSNIAASGFSAGGLVKAEDFNAALRMTTLVCAGIAKVFGLDSTYTIDASEKTITDAIQNASITLGDVTFSDITSSSIISNGIIHAKGRITSDNSYNLGGYTVIDNGLNIMGTSYKTIRGVPIIDSVGNITGTDITASGILKGNSLNINGTERITNNGDITGASVTVNKAAMTQLGFAAGSMLVIDNNANISAESVISKTITATGILNGNSLNINGTNRIDSSGNITGVSYKVGSNNVIDSSRNITGTNITGTNITANSVLKGTSLNINGTERIKSTGDITGATITSNGKLACNYLYVGGSSTSPNAIINSTGNITVNNITSNDIITDASIKTRVAGVVTERITNSGIILPSKLNLKNIVNCAYIDNSDVYITIGKGDGTTGGYLHFGAKIPGLSYSSAEAQKQILLACISINTSGNGETHKFNSVYTTILTGYPDTNQGTATFNIYSGNGTSIGESWGQIRISYQPYSWFSTSNPIAPSCYIAYKKDLDFADIITNIRVELYPIATFN